MGPKTLAHRASVETDLRRLSPYKHEPLPGSEYVRILEIIPERPEYDSINCKIRIIRLQDARILGSYLRPTSMSSSPEKSSSARKLVRSASSIKGYEALSWTWGAGPKDRAMRVLDENNNASLFMIQDHLFQALLALRYDNRPRYLWIDGICIDQSNIPERNQQVAQMSEVYGGAKNVCIWLGTADGQTTEAFNFVRDKVLDVYSFDSLCKDKQYLSSWTALLGLMKRDWFSRRWIVQEVSLARRATVHCGIESIDWQDFAAAVSLFVDVESSVFRLSKLARKEETLNYAKDFFEEVPALGATSLVKTTNMLFRKSSGGLLQRTATLEDIVARLAMFRTSEPRDTVYALLALAKDSSPSVGGIPSAIDDEPLTPGQKNALSTMTRLLPSTRRQRYVIDYKQRIVHVYQQFIAFSISRAEPTRALDIICRPFAQTYSREQDVSFDPELVKKLKNPKEKVPLPSWIPNVSEVPYKKQKQPRKGQNRDQEEMFVMTRQRGDPFVSTPDAISYSAAGSRGFSKSKVRFRKRHDDVFSMFVEGFVLDTVASIAPASQGGTIPDTWFDMRDKHEVYDEDIFWKTLVADRGPRGNDAPVFYQRTIQTALKFAQESDERPGEFVTARHIEQTNSDLVSGVLRQIQATIWGRLLFDTKRLLLGLAPRQTKPGDLVCILYGCSVPIILREIEKTPEDIAREEHDDELDLQRRMQKAKPFIENWAARYRRNHPGTGEAVASETDLPVQVPAVVEVAQAAGVEATLGKSTSAVGDQQWALAANLFQHLPPATRRIIGHLMLTIILVKHEQMSATMLLLLAAPHIWTETAARCASSASPWTTFLHREFSTLSALVSILAIIWYFSEFTSSIYAAIVMISFDVLYPEVVPPSTAQTAWAVMLKLWKWLHHVYTAWFLEIPRTAAALPAERLRVAVTPTVIVTQHSDPDPSSFPAPVPTPAPASPTPQKKPRLPMREVNPKRYYKLIGECYVHNMMNGEAIEWQNESVANPERERVPSRTFELR